MLNRLFRFSFVVMGYLFLRSAFPEAGLSIGNREHSIKGLDACIALSQGLAHLLPTVLRSGTYWFWILRLLPPE